MIEVLPEVVFLSESEVEDLRMPAYKSHLREFCDFSDIDLNTLFRLIHTRPHVLCKVYDIRIPKTPPEDWPQICILKIMSGATRFGPQTERLLKFINRHNLCQIQP